MIEGKVLQVEESWPVGLVVEVGMTKRWLTLADETPVFDRGVAANPGHIKPGQKVQLVTDDDNEAIVIEIRIID